jgi:restriction system protein
LIRGEQTDDAQTSPAEAAPSAQSAVPQSTPEEQIEKAFITLQSALRTEVLQRISQNTPGFFEELIIDLLVKMDYNTAWPVWRWRSRWYH